MPTTIRSFQVTLVPHLANNDTPAIALPLDVIQQMNEVIANKDDYNLLMEGTVTGYSHFDWVQNDNLTLTLTFQNATISIYGDPEALESDAVLKRFLEDDVSASLSDGWGENGDAFGPLVWFLDGDIIPDADVTVYPHAEVVRDPNQYRKFPPDVALPPILNPDWVRTRDSDAAFYGTRALNGRSGRYYYLENDDDYDSRVDVPDSDVTMYSSYQIYVNPHDGHYFPPGMTPVEVPPHMIENTTWGEVGFTIFEGRYVQVYHGGRYMLVFGSGGVELI